MNETIEVGGTWQAAGIDTTYARVWGKDENGESAVIASGSAKVRKTGEPISVMIEGWRPADGAPWDLVHNGGAPACWMIDAQQADYVARGE
jgi:hypothetical protein